ncbi:MAG: hypothetical protein JWQ01_3143 [Massilia sp.]|nr:hypothetical protein [Massilia sp.]
MSIRFIKAVTLLACAVFSTLALAQETPARVGRVSLAQGQVSISGEAGDESNAALVNWPVTSHNRLTTGRGARTEIRIGSTSVRLDADSSLDVSELDDASLRLRLNYGSASVRVRNAEVLPGFELETPNGRVRMQEPGRLRVDAERERGTSVINVFDGVALVDDRGSQLIVRAGKRAEIRDDDVRTGVALRDGFDDWAQQRDLRDDRSTSARYVTSEMTGYEDLDQNGVWREDAEYGPLWMPTVVASGWAPYRDGNWTWVSPWGWTWVDNAPWGYAPFHYGRWVQVNQRWAWAPGRHVGRPVWAPALVGWVGGGGWNLSFGSRGHRPAQGWYPLSPRDAFVPGYRLSHQHLQHLNRDARNDRDDHRHDWRNDHRRDGLTVVPQEQFGRRGTVAVRNAPHAVVPPQALQSAPSVAPSAPQGTGRSDRFEHRQPRPELNAPSAAPFVGRDSRPGEERGQRPQRNLPTPAAVMTAPAPLAAPPQFGRRDAGRDPSGRPAGMMPPPAAPQPMPQPMMPRSAAPMPMPQPMMPPAAAPQPMPQPIVQQPAPEQQRGRQWRNEASRQREPEPVQQPRPQAAPAPMQQMIQQAQQHAAQQAAQQAQQQAQQQARQQPAPAPAATGEQRSRQGGSHKGRDDQER